MGGRLWRSDFGSGGSIRTFVESDAPEELRQFRKEMFEKHGRPDEHYKANLNGEG